MAINVKLSNFDEKELLNLNKNILNELKERQIIRTNNNPIGDYGEWLSCKSLKLNIEKNSNAGYDASDKKGIRYQIKCRKITSNNKSKQLSVIRNFENNNFDFLIGLIFNETYDLKEAYKIPHNLIKKYYPKFNKHQNGYIVHLKGEILKDRLVKNIINNFTNPENTF